MKWALVLAALLLPAAQHAEQPALGIFFQFDEEPPAASLEAMKAETRTLLEQSGITPAWRRLGTNDGTEAFSKVFFVRFKGSCRAPLVSQAHAGEWEPFEPATRLGAARVHRGSVLPLAEIDCNPIQKSIGQVPSKHRALAFGWVMARVVAHELYHVLLQTTGHSREGLSKSVLNWRELGARSTRFGKADLERMGASFKNH